MELKEYIYEKLKEFDIKYDVVNHKALYSKKDTDTEIFEKDVVIGKNLFLRNKNKTKFYLVILPLDKKADLKKLENMLKEIKLSFANEKELEQHLKILPGSVSYLNIITADILSGNYSNVNYIIDREILLSKKIGVHPSDNTATVITKPSIIEEVFKKYNVEYQILDL